MQIVAEGRRSKLTSSILKCISYHLSSRQDCKGIEYVVIIRADEINNQDEIIISPYITVFPGIHDRKDCDRRSVAYHVILYHFPELFEDANQVSVHIKKNSLIYGTYIFKQYESTNRRKWIKLK